MPFGDAFAALDVEADAVVPDGERDDDPVRFACHADRLCRAVTDGVRDEFADDAQDGVGRRVVDARARHVEADGDSGLEREPVEHPPDGRGEVGLLKRVVPQVPEAARQFRAAGQEHPFGRREQGPRL